jgi:uncharacterized protein (TIGR03437 family)
VTPAVDEGVAAPPSTSASLPNVFLGGRQLAVSYSGLAPGLAGVWQIDVVLPMDAPTGPDMGLNVVQGIGGNAVGVTVVR